MRKVITRRAALAEGLTPAAIRHRLSSGAWQRPLDPEDEGSRGRRLDFRDRERGLGLEVDGALWHRDRALNDRRRDREAAGEGGLMLRAGWVEVVAYPCGANRVWPMTVVGRGRHRHHQPPRTVCAGGSGF